MADLAEKKLQRTAAPVATASAVTQAPTVTVTSVATHSPVK